MLQRQFGRAPSSGPQEAPAADVTHQSWYRDSTEAGRSGGDPRGAALKVASLSPAARTVGGTALHPDLSPSNPCSLMGLHRPPPIPRVPEPV